ncbi:hypothetical protein [Priestia megaterium]
MSESYNTQENHTIIISTERYDKQKEEYEVISKTIKKIILHLSDQFTLYNYYKENYTNRENIELFAVLKKLINKDIVAFEPLDLTILNSDYILELFIVGLDKNSNIMKDFIHNKEFSNMNDLEEFLSSNQDIKLTCQIYDSAYMKIDSTDSQIIESIKQIL